MTNTTSAPKTTIETTPRNAATSSMCPSCLFSLPTNTPNGGVWTFRIYPSIIHPMVLKRFVVQRTGNKVHKTDLDTGLSTETTPISPTALMKRTWRSALRHITNDGEDAMVVLRDLMEGRPFVATLPDGRQSEPVIPSPEVRRAAAVDVLHLLHGKPVAQTEVLKAEREAEDVERYKAMSLDALVAAAAPLLARSSAPALLSEGKGEEDDD